jgi:hypothetical protein
LRLGRAKGVLLFENVRCSTRTHNPARTTTMAANPRLVGFPRRPSLLAADPRLVHLAREAADELSASPHVQRQVAMDAFILHAFILPRTVDIAGPTAGASTSTTLLTRYAHAYRDCYAAHVGHFSALQMHEGVRIMPRSKSSSTSSNVDAASG